MEIDEQLGKRKSHPVPTWAENPRIYSQRGGSAGVFPRTVEFLKGNMVNMEIFCHLSDVIIGLTGPLDHFQ